MSWIKRNIYWPVFLKNGLWQSTEIHWDVLRFRKDRKQMLSLQTVVTGVETQRGPSEASLAKATGSGRIKWVNVARVYMRKDTKHKPGTDNVTKAASDVDCPHLI